MERIKDFRVLLVSDMGKVGGTEVATLISANLLEKNVDRVCIFGKKGVLSKSFENKEIEQIDAICHSVNPINLLLYIIKMISVINKYNINIIHSQMARPIPLIWIARFFSKNRRKIKILWTSRGLKSKSYSILVPLFAFLDIRALGNCKKEQEKLIYYGYDREKTNYIYNPYRLVPTEKSMKTLNKKRISIGTLSALRKDRCVDIFLEIANYILKNNESIHEFEFIIGGDGNCLNELKNLANSLSISNNVKFLGRIDNVEVFMEKLDIFVSPLIVENDSGAGVSNAIVEAMIMNVPVCAFDAAGISEIVINEQTGFLIEPNNIVAMSEAIKFLIENEYIAIKYTKNAFNLISRECSPEIYIKKLVNLYENF